METMGMILLVLGVLVAVIGALGLLIAAFRESIWWGLGCLLFSFMELFFLVFHWREAKGSFGLQLLGTVVFAVGAYLVPESMWQ